MEIETRSAEPKVGDKFTAPTTTEAQESKAVGQREISKIWETTQQKIALGVTGFALVVAAWLAVSKQEAVAIAACVFLYGAANLVIGFYFGRTNHQKVGGVGGESEIGGR